MAKIGRPGLSRQKRAELWEHWKSGECASDIARALARTKGAIHHVLAFNGGIAPVARRRCAVAMLLNEREEISRGIAGGESIRRIAAGLGRSPSTVSREVARHGGRESYRATEADARAWEWALRPKPCRLAGHPELRWRVIEKLALDWSLEQISGWLKREFPADESLRVSHETIYRSLFVQSRGVLRKELIGHLRAGRRMRNPKGGTTPAGCLDRSSMQFPSANVRPKSRTAPFQAIGKATCSRVPTTRTWRRWSSVILASPC